jgi:hypothetical protein
MNLENAAVKVRVERVLRRLDRIEKTLDVAAQVIRARRRALWWNRWIVAR